MYKHREFAIVVDQMLHISDTFPVGFGSGHPSKAYNDICILEGQLIQLYWAAFSRMCCTLRLRRSSVSVGDVQCLPRLAWRKSSNWPIWSSSRRLNLMGGYKRGCEVRWWRPMGSCGEGSI